MRFIKIALILAVGTGLLGGCCNCDKTKPLATEPDTAHIQNTAADTADSLLLNTETATLVFTLKGSALIRFELKQNPVNPFTWGVTTQQMPKVNQQASDYVFQGHFLCMNRWGAPSDAEIAAGIPFNGEVNTQKWQVVQAPTQQANQLVAQTTCHLPNEHMQVSRKITMGRQSAFFLMEENYENLIAVGRLTNVVQHATLGPPFLDSNVLVDCNAGWGYDQRTQIGHYQDSSFRWPNAQLKNYGEANLRQQNIQDGYVVSHVFDDSVQVGYLTATNPNQGLLLGYVFSTHQHPWVDVWHHWDAEKNAPMALGLEFGTTGSGAPYDSLALHYTHYKGVPQFEYHHAKATRTKKYICFLMPVPKGFKGVANLKISDTGLISITGYQGERLQLQALPL